MSELLTRCEVCGGLLDEEDLFCANCGTEAPHDGSSADQPQSALLTHSFSCQGCGASMSYDASAGALRCPFCGSEELLRKEAAKTLAPHEVIPFVMTQEQAIAAMREWLGRSFWRPGDLAREAQVHTMTKVYVPYWIFTAKTHTYWTADSSRTPPGARGDWYPLFGEHRGEYRGLLVSASGALSQAETGNLAPFRLHEGLPLEQVDLRNVTCEEFSMPRKFARPLARQGIETAESQTCEQYVPGNCRNMHVNVLISGLSSYPVLLPVWIMAYRYKGKVYRFLVNGQTGKATGGAPWSWPKIIGAALLAIVAAVVVLAIIGAIAAR